MIITNKRYLYIRHVANNCVKLYHTRNPIIILNKIGIEPTFLHLENEEFQGCTSRNENDEPFVYISDKYDTYSTKIIAAHELGHVLLHNLEFVNMFDDEEEPSEIEYEANLFAVELIPWICPTEDYLEFTPKQLKEHICSKLFQKDTK